LVLVAAFALPTGAAAVSRPEKSPLVAQSLNSAKGVGAWQGPQFLQADRKGRVSILRPATLEIFSFREDGSLQKSGKLEANSMERSGARGRAAMSPGGDWLIQEGARIALFRDGKETTLADPGWYLRGLGWLRDDPLLSVEPARTVPAPAPKGPPPLVLRWTGKAWETMIAEPMPPGVDDPLDESVRTRRWVELLGDSRGTLWVANSYRYLVQRYSSSGKLKLKIAVGKGEVERRKDAAQAQRAFAGEIAESGRTAEKGFVAQAATGLQVLDALAEGRDGKMYFLVHQGWEGGDFALDRYDAVRAVLERALVRLQNVGVMTMASGKDGLYLAAFSAQRGRWKISWEDIDAAAWKPIKDARIDDFAQAGDEP
jgi:hypothetical protein